jgi:hypothetical protein
MNARPIIPLPGLENPGFARIWLTVARVIHCAPQNIVSLES